MIKTGLIGYGYWGPNIARSLSTLSRTTLGVICDLSENRREAASGAYPGVRISGSIEDVLDDPSVQAVIIATPASTHADVAIRALKKGKHVLIEKPLATSVRDALAIGEAQKTAGTVVMVGHTFEYNPAVIAAKRYLKSERFGNVFYAYSRRVNLGQVRGDVNALWNLAPHDISIYNYWFDATPIDVLAVGTSHLQKNIEDVVFVMLRYPGNVFAEIHVSWLDPTKERTLTVVGSRQMLVFDDLSGDAPIRLFDKRVITAEVARGLATEYRMKLHSGPVVAPVIKHREPLTEELSDFISAITKGVSPRTDYSNGLRVVRVLAACEKSIASGNVWVKIRE